VQGVFIRFGMLEFHQRCVSFNFFDDAGTHPFCRNNAVLVGKVVLHVENFLTHLESRRLYFPIMTPFFLEEQKMMVLSKGRNLSEI